MSGSATLGTTNQLDWWAAGGAGDSGYALGTGTGQQGHQQVDTSNVGNPFSAVFHWLNTPFTTPMSPWSVALLVGVVLVSVIAWNLLLYHIRIAAESI